LLPQAHPAASGYPPAASARPAPGSFQPFLGASALGLNLVTGNVNQARLASSASHAVSQPSLPARGSRAASSTRGRGTGGRGTGRRGNAATLPSLPQEGPIISRNACLIEDNSIPSVQVTVMVFPPLVRLPNLFQFIDYLHFLQLERDQEFIAYRFLRTAVSTYLLENGLLFHYCIPQAFRVVELLTAVANSMQNSQMAYQFAPFRDGIELADHERLPFKLLSYKSRGQARRGNKGIGLAEYAFSPDLTVRNLFDQTRVFSPAAAFEDGRFIINLGKLSYLLPRLR
jgi:hypothetical protein